MEQLRHPSKRTPCHITHWKATQHTLSSATVSLGCSAHSNSWATALVAFAITVLGASGMGGRDGSLYPGSTCACGYSVSSILVFSLVFFALTVLVLWLLLKKVELHIPPARHCSIVISAACHLPEDDVYAQLEEVQWGVTEEGTDHEAGHCTFTSGNVMTQAGLLYK